MYNEEVHNDKWDKRFLKLAKHIAQWSKDPNTKCGSVVVRHDKTVASVGFNGFPKWTKDKEISYQDREKKLHRVVHAELNALLHTYEDITGYTIYSSTAPCSGCAGSIIQKGIMVVVAPISFPSRWAASIAEGLEMFEEARVEVRLIG